MARPSNENYLDRNWYRSPSKTVAPVQRLVGALRRWPGITEISLAAFFSPFDFFTNGATVRCWSHRISAVIAEAERDGLVRKVQCLDPAYHSYFAIETTEAVQT